MARCQCLQRYPAHRLLADVGLPQSAVRTCPLHPKRSRPPMSFLQEQRSYSPLGLHMMSTRFSTARTQGPARACYIHTPCENSNSVTTSTLSSNSWHDIAAREISQSAPGAARVSFLLKTRRIADSHANVRRWARSCFPS